MLHVILSTICFKSMLKIQNSLQKPMQAHTKSNKKKEKTNRCSFFMELKINDSIVQCSNLAWVKPTTTMMLTTADFYFFFFHFSKCQYPHRIYRRNRRKQRKNTKKKNTNFIIIIIIFHIVMKWTCLALCYCFVSLCSVHTLSLNAIFHNCFNYEFITFRFVSYFV